VSYFYAQIYYEKRGNGKVLIRFQTRKGVRYISGITAGYEWSGFSMVYIERSPMSGVFVCKHFFNREGKLIAEDVCNSRYDGGCIATYSQDYIEESINDGRFIPITYDKEWALCRSQTWTPSIDFDERDRIAKEGTKRLRNGREETLSSLHNNKHLKG
jgi:hypothetical protein